MSPYNDTSRKAAEGDSGNLLLSNGGRFIRPNIFVYFAKFLPCHSPVFIVFIYHIRGKKTGHTNLQTKLTTNMFSLC